MNYSRRQVRAAKVLAYRALFQNWARTKKYFLFIIALQIYKLLCYLALNPAKGKLLEAFYLVHRYIDDVADGDTLPTLSKRDRIEYIVRKLYFTRHAHTPYDAIEHLIEYYRTLSHRCGEDFTLEAWDILESMHFDAVRMGTNMAFSRRKLEHNYHRLDERGTVRPMLRLFGEDVTRFADLAPLAKAVRIYYNTRDLQIDAARGLINTPSEDCQRYGITPPELAQTPNDNINAWLAEQAKQGLQMLQIHRRILKRKPFKAFTQFVLWIMYERETELFLTALSEGGTPKSDEARA